MTIDAIILLSIVALLLFLLPDSRPIADDD